MWMPGVYPVSKVFGLPPDAIHGRER